jgi:broad specificity phosphatase PhoE
MRHGYSCSNASSPQDVKKRFITQPLLTLGGIAGVIKYSKQLKEELNTKKIDHYGCSMLPRTMLTAGIAACILEKDDDREISIFIHPFIGEMQNFGEKLLEPFLVQSQNLSQLEISENYSRVVSYILFKLFKKRIKFEFVLLSSINEPNPLKLCSDETRFMTSIKTLDKQNVLIVSHGKILDLVLLKKPVFTRHYSNNITTNGRYVKVFMKPDNKPEIYDESLLSKILEEEQTLEKKTSNSSEKTINELLAHVSFKDDGSEPDVIEPDVIDSEDDSSESFVLVEKLFTEYKTNSIEKFLETYFDKSIISNISVLIKNETMRKFLTCTYSYEKDVLKFSTENIEEDILKDISVKEPYNMRENEIY